MPISLTLTVNDMAEHDAAVFFENIAAVFAKAKRALTDAVTPAPVAPAVEPVAESFPETVVTPEAVTPPAEPKKRGPKPRNTGVSAPVTPAPAKAPLIDDPIPDFGVPADSADVIDAVPEVSLDELRDFGNMAIKKGHREEVLQVLKKYNASKYPEIPADKYAEALAAIKKAIGA